MQSCIDLPNDHKTMKIFGHLWFHW